MRVGKKITKKNSPSCVKLVQNFLLLEQKDFINNKLHMINMPEYSNKTNLTLNK